MSDEQDLIGRLKQGDEEVCGLILVKFGPGLKYRLIRKYWSLKYMVDDVITDSVVKAWMRREFSTEKHLKSWLFKVADNFMKDCLKSPGHKALLLELCVSWLGAVAGVGGCGPAGLSSEGAGPRKSGSGEWRESAAVSQPASRPKEADLREVVLALPQSDQLIVVIRHLWPVDDTGYAAEAAALLGISEGAVRQRLRDILGDIREEMKRRGHQVSDTKGDQP